MTATTLAGIRFVTDENLVEADDSGFSDVEVTAVWVEPGEMDLGTPVVAPGQTFFWVNRESRTVWLPALRDSDIMRAWQLRQIAAGVAACFDRLTIHASAVAIDGSVVALCAASEAGKSTLAWSLVKEGATPISDDLLPIRFCDRPCVPHDDDQLPLSGIYFLSRDNATLSATPLDASTALQRHIENGFGEHGESDTWAFQFDAYHRLATGTRHFDLVIPDDRWRLSEVADWLIAHTRESTGSI